MYQQFDKAGNLEVTFRHSPPNYQKVFPNSTAILAISIGQKYHEAEKFEATIKLMNRSNFQKCVIMLGDTLQRHNLLIDDFDDEKAAHIQASKLGDEWIERNKLIYSKLQTSYEIIRWDAWLMHPLYKECREKVNELYRTDNLFKIECLKTATQFMERYQKRMQLQQKQINMERALELCLEYLLEECAIIMPLWARYSYNFLIYPSMPDGMLATYNALVKPYYPSNILHWLSFRFKRK
jgi:tRNA-dependent cyclodipeptide synthase